MFVRLTAECLDETRDRRGIKKSCVLGCKYILPPGGGILHILMRLVLEQLLQPLVLILRDFALGEQLLQPRDIILGGKEVLQPISSILAKV